ncbi:MAG: metallophosphoesterase [Desulfurococcales archaeon]|nr:metallophosphoesterase [Desulfurococcales archaeon]
MRIGFASDLHIPNSDIHKIGNMIVESSVDILVLVGDVVNLPDDASLRKLAKFLDKYSPNRIIAVLGNHEHYMSKRMREKGRNSIDAVNRVKRFYKDTGIILLDQTTRPYRVGRVSLAGCVGWYDYSLAPPGYTDKDFEACNPFGYSLKEVETCEKKAYWFNCPKWWRRDCLLISLPFPHHEYVVRCMNLVSEQLSNSSGDKIVVYHHVPNQYILEYTGTDKDFDLAYAGSNLLDNPIREHNVKLVVYGHVHNHSNKRITEIKGVLYGNAYPLYKKNPGLLVYDFQSSSDVFFVYNKQRR